MLKGPVENYRFLCADGVGYLLHVHLVLCLSALAQSFAETNDNLS